MESNRKDRASDYCAYTGCTNGRLTTGSRLFRFPNYNDPRLAVWVTNSGNERLRSFTSSTLRRRGLCEEHFEPKYFISEYRLALSAVPKVYVQPAHVSVETSNSRVTDTVEDQWATSGRYATESETAASGPSPSIDRYQIQLDKSDEGLYYTPSTSAPSTPISASSSNAADAEVEASKHVCECPKPEPDFRESEDEHCTSSNVEPVMLSNPSSGEPLRVETLLNTISSLRKEVADANKSNEVLKRETFLQRKAIRQFRWKLKRLSAENRYLSSKLNNKSADASIDRDE